MPVTVRTVTERQELDRLDEAGSTLCWEGLPEGDEQRLADMLAGGLALPELSDAEIGVVAGAVMNDVYGLTGENAYPADLRLALVTVPDHIRATHFAELAARDIRFFDNIVTNNAAHQRGQDG